LTKTTQKKSATMTKELGTMTTFTVLKFSRADGAQYMLSTLQRLQEQRLIQIEDAAIVTWPRGAWRPKTKQLSNLTGVGALDGAFWGMLFGLLFAIPFFGLAAGTAIGTLTGYFARYGIDERLIKKIRDQITEDTSALFLLTSWAMLDRVVAAVKGLPFEIISTTLSNEQEDQLRQAFGE
jgi:uncharacterized membrane protein